MTSRHSPFTFFLCRIKQRAQSGATAVEMALIAPIFFFLLMGMIEISLMIAGQQLLENAAYNTSRLAKTGYSVSGQTQSQTVASVLTKELKGFGTLIDTTKVTMTSTSYTSFSNINNVPGTGGMGNAQEIVVYTVTYPWKLFTPMLSDVIGDVQGNVNLTSRIVVRNEPY